MLINILIIDIYLCVMKHNGSKYIGMLYKYGFIQLNEFIKLYLNLITLEIENYTTHYQIISFILKKNDIENAI